DEAAPRDGPPRGGVRRCVHGDACGDADRTWHLVAGVLQSRKSEGAVRSCPDVSRISAWTSWLSDPTVLSRAATAASEFGACRAASAAASPAPPKYHHHRLAHAGGLLVSSHQFCVAHAG